MEESWAPKRESTSRVKTLTSRQSRRRTSVTSSLGWSRALTWCLPPSSGRPKTWTPSGVFWETRGNTSSSSQRYIYTSLWYSYSEGSYCFCLCIRTFQFSKLVCSVLKSVWFAASYYFFVLSSMVGKPSSIVLVCICV